MTKENLGPDWQIVCQIFEDTLLEGKKITFRDLVKETGLDKNTVSRNLTKAEDLNFVKSRYANIGKGWAGRIYEVSFMLLDNIMDTYGENFKEVSEEDFVLEEGSMGTEVEGYILYNQIGDKNCGHEKTYREPQVDGSLIICEDCGREVFYPK